MSSYRKTTATWIAALATTAFVRFMDIAVLLHRGLCRLVLGPCFRLPTLLASEGATPRQTVKAGALRHRAARGCGLDSPPSSARRGLGKQRRQIASRMLAILRLPAVRAA